MQENILSCALIKPFFCLRNAQMLSGHKCNERDEERCISNMISSKAGQRTNLLKVNLVVVLISFNTLKITAVEFLFGGTVQEENPMVPNTLTDQTRERISNP
ncbi:uncharacterized protein [Physcomitrium patens]|uniref:uncharacterized protein isoform X1 n=1 Tax=Physcomitrium patens TaxID=3218 RepID=UPI003CCDA169